MKNAQTINSRITKNHKDRVLYELLAHGVSKFGLLKMESRHLPKLIHADEHITGVVYGRYPDGSAMLVATDKRVLFLDCKPLFVKSVELAYDVIGGVTFNNVGLLAMVTLHSRLGNFSLKTLNQRSAAQFVKYIEFRCLEQYEVSKSATQYVAYPAAAPQFQR